MFTESPAQLQYRPVELAKDHIRYKYRPEITHQPGKHKKFACMKWILPFGRLIVIEIIPQKNRNRCWTYNISWLHFYGRPWRRQRGNRL